MEDFNQALNQTPSNFMASTIRKITPKEFKAIIFSNRFEAKCLYLKGDNRVQKSDGFLPIRFSSSRFGMSEIRNEKVIYLNPFKVFKGTLFIHEKITSGEVVFTVSNYCRFVLRKKGSYYAS